MTLTTLFTTAILMLDPEPIPPPGSGIPGPVQPSCKIDDLGRCVYPDKKAPKPTTSDCTPCQNGCIENVCVDLPAPATPGSIANVDESGFPQIALDLENLGYMCTMIDIDGFERGDCEIYKWSCAAGTDDKTYCADSLGYSWTQL